MDVSNTVDDWITDSIRKYSHLYMYELQSPAYAVEWIHDDEICISCIKKGRTELLQMRVPGKLLKEKDEVQGLCNERDFQLVGGNFHNGAVNQIVQLPFHKPCKKILTAEESCNKICLWSLASHGSGVLDKLAVIENYKTESIGSHIANGSSCQTRESEILFGSSLDCTCVVDANTLQHTYTTAGKPSSYRISRLLWLDTNTFLACCENGTMYQFDTRTRAAHSIHYPVPEQCKGRWTCDLMTSCQGCALVSSEGHIVAKDINELHKNVAVTKADVQPCMSNDSSLTVNVPDQGSFLSISGINDKVWIFQQEELYSAKECVKPCLCYEGHPACSQDDNIHITTHAWHPFINNLIVSMATDDSLHAWQFIV
eukprot:GHVU01090657.1.p1 GENE.GHVU01090657.1~~GHVU01090657.1.p1  ORF type:complete len:370 (+),score=25.74 GHVU01090657.1:15-1124(+)